MSHQVIKSDADLLCNSTVLKGLRVMMSKDLSGEVNAIQVESKFTLEKLKSIKDNCQNSVHSFTLSNSFQETS